MTPRIRVRFAPSPTGFLHIGSLRTALYNELLARRHGGDFILRIEDTDRTRFVPGAIENICQTLKAVDIVPDEGVWLGEKGEVVERGEFGPYLQSKRKETHLGYAQKLMEMDKAYHCFCTEKRLTELREQQQLTRQPTMYDGLCRAIPRPEAEKRIANGEAHVIRLKLPKQGAVTVWDAIRNDATFDWNLIDDQVIIKSDGFPTYHLAATCDDHDMQITHVIRGDEWISSTPKHLFIYEAFGWTPPTFAHLPLLLNPDKSKLSKRQGDVAAEDFLKKGFVPEALVNFVALLGWNPSGDREVYSKTELIEAFDLAKINKSGAVFDLQKLEWMNQQYLRSMPVERYLTLVHPFVADRTDDHAFADRVLLLVRDRVTLPKDAEDLTAGFFAASHDFEKVKLSWKAQTPSDVRMKLEAVRNLLIKMDESVFAKDTAVMELETRMKKLILDNGWGNGDTLWPLRVALSGSEKSPTPFELLWAYGKERGVRRIEDALKHVSEV